jgi:hypothetical protein
MNIGRYLANGKGEPLMDSAIVEIKHQRMINHATQQGKPNNGMHRSARRELRMDPGVVLARPVMPDVRWQKHSNQMYDMNITSKTLICLLAIIAGHAHKGLGYNFPRKLDR